MKVWTPGNLFAGLLMFVGIPIGEFFVLRIVWSELRAIQDTTGWEVLRRLAFALILLALAAYFGWLWVLLAKSLLEGKSGKARTQVRNAVMDAGREMNGPSWDLLKAECMAFLGRNGRAAAEALAGGKSAEQTAWLLLMRTAEQHVTSGQHHVYRGVLDLTGEHLLRVFDLCTGKLVESGAMPKRDAEHARAEVRAAIRTVG